MSELLIELFCEEIPARMQLKAERAYQDIFTEYFRKKEISFKELKVFSGARRITIYANGINSTIEGKLVSIKGPRVDSSLPAIEGFCKSQ